MKQIENTTKLSVKIAKMIQNEVNINSNINTEYFDYYQKARENLTELLNFNDLKILKETMMKHIQHIPTNYRYDYLKYMKNLLLNISENYTDRLNKYKFQIETINLIVNDNIKNYE